MAKPLTRDDMIALGNFFAAQKPLPIGFKADGARVEAGRKVSDAVLCPMCHLGGFVGQNEIPRVAGQHPQYVKKQLSDFKAKRRTNDAGNMTSVAGDAVGRGHREPVAVHRQSELSATCRARSPRCAARRLLARARIMMAPPPRA